MCLVVVLIICHSSSIAHAKYAGSVPSDRFDRMTAGFRPPSVPLVVVDPYFR